MQIALFGGLANNMYIVAKALHASGQDIIFVRDRFDTYPFSQPIWQDAALAMCYEELESGWFNSEYWTAKEREEHWRSPTWMHDPFDAETSYRARIHSSLAVRTYFRWRRWRDKLWAQTLQLIRSADAVIVCGVHGEVIAAASGLPYVIWPHGGDIRIAAGFGVGSRSRTWREKLRNRGGKFVHTLRNRAVRDAFLGADWVSVQSPKVGGGHFVNIEPFLRRLSYGRLPLPYGAVPRRTAPERRRALEILLARFGLSMPTETLYGFVPARLDYYYKGHNSFLEALHHRPQLDFHWFLSGWGADYKRGQEYVEEKRLQHCITFLPVALSRPLLFEFMMNVDVCVDQFRGGDYGASALEAMAHGTPVMMRIINKNFDERGWEAPPVLNASNTDDIVRILDRIASGDIDLEERSRAASAWVSRWHAPHRVLPALLQRLEAAVACGHIR